MTQPVRNGLIAFARTNAAGLQQIFTINADGSGEQQLTTIGENFFPAWSWDGQRLVFTSTRSGTPEIWTMDADGAHPAQITFNTTGGNFVPEWSPDQSKIVFASQSNGAGHPEVWVMNADGSQQTQLTTTPVSQTGPTWSLLANWSPDGTRIVYASTKSGSSQIWMMNADGTGQVQMTSGNGPGFPDSNAPDWSRDGSKIVFWSGFETQFGEVWVMDSDGANKAQLTATVDPKNSDNPEWAPDGSMILFDTNRAGPVEMWSMDPSGVGPVAIVAATGGQMSWQPIVTALGDVNGDGVVDGVDLATLLGLWGSADPTADLNGDGVVDGADLATLLSNWG